MKNANRESGIELLKVVAIFLIVLCHISSCMSASTEFSTAEWYRDINLFPNSIEKILLTFFNYCGFIGNNIFFVCSAWFLLEKKQNRKSKILKLEVDVWTISMVYLAIFFFSNVRFSGSMVIRSMFPTTFSFNWFVTAYMLFYFIYPGLNLIIEKIPRISLKYGCLFFVFLICLWTPFFQEWSDFKFFFSYPLMWVLVYFCIAYLKKYHCETIKSRRFSIVVLCIGIVGLLAEITASYYLGSTTFLIGTNGMRWNMWWNPLHWFIAFGSFNLFRTFHFHSRFINRISSLSLLVYLIHENFLVRDHWRPFIYIFIHRYHGDQVSLWLLVFALLTFIVSIVIAFLYQITIQKFAYRMIDKLCNGLKRLQLRKCSKA